ncbi:hypothetical protein TWF696_009098 [Orbilia brochopaga]|uniref:Uncharacterized protein n=1 Tax=Orbilia brochopaga TaxID=3140254 RepID=A0AAV9UE27_9PEZI
MQYMYSILRPRSVRLSALIPAVGVLLLLYYLYIRLHVIDSGPDALRQPFSDDQHSAIFEPPVASVQHSVIRGDNAAWTNDRNTNWYSVGRHPNRPECWTYKDRFGVYKDIPPAISTAISTNNDNNVNSSKRAVILRLGSNQRWGPEFTVQTRALVLEAGYVAKYDIVILTHLDMDKERKAKWIQRVPKEFRPLLQTVSTKQVRDWLPSKAITKFKNIFEQNHLVIQMFMAQNPKYEFVYSVESDVRLIGRWDQFLKDVDIEYAYHRSIQGPEDMPVTPDLVTFGSVRRPQNDWLWLDNDCVKYFGGVDNTRHALGAVWGWSRRLTDAMTQANDQDGINCYYEYFAPSLAYKRNFTTFFYQHPLYCPRTSPSERYSMMPEQLGKNDPRLVQYNKAAVGCTYYFVNPHSQPFWEQWYRDPAVCRPPALVHPVKGDFFN